MSDDEGNDSTDWGIEVDDEPALPAGIPERSASWAPPELRPDPPVVEAAPQPEVFAEEDFDKTDDEPFDRPDAQKFGIIGGKGVGKSYLFQSMVYRTLSGTQSGALTHYLERDNMRLFTAMGEESTGGRQIARTGAARTLNRTRFIEKYQNWLRLPSTTKEIQTWYRLRLPLRTGWLGQKRSAIDVEFFDGSGEGMFEIQSLTRDDREVWEKAYLPAKVMVFCLPLWAAFPNGDLTDEDWGAREKLLSGFEQVLVHYRDMRSRHGEPPVSGILALTMADDRRSALRTLYDRWIAPYLDSPSSHLRQLKQGSGIARYLNNARKVSEALHEEFGATRDPRVSGIPQSLDFGRGKPWIVALSAIDGGRFDYLNNKYPDDPDNPARMREARQVAPTPIHVELPLLVALCERENALM
jgi:hypothetical protein